MYVSRITVYPIKSLDGIDVPYVAISDSGGLQNDRRFAMFDRNGKYVNGKSTPAVHRLRTCFDLSSDSITITTPSDTVEFNLISERHSINIFLSDYFQQEVELKEDLSGSFLDNPEESRLTVVSRQSLARVSSWFGWDDENEAHRRFRPNLVVDDAPAFWEDSLFQSERQGVQFRIADNTLTGTGPCPRCIVPSRNPLTGQHLREFQKQFSSYRAKELPSWSTLAAFGHFYQLATNCLVIPNSPGAKISIGDMVETT